MGFISRMRDAYQRSHQQTGLGEIAAYVLGGFFYLGVMTLFGWLMFVCISTFALIFVGG